MMGMKGNTESIQYVTWKPEPWTLRKNYSSEMSDCISKSEYFKKPRITVMGSSQWQLSVISIFWVIWEKVV